MCADNNEVELDIDSLDTATLRELQRYVARCLDKPIPGAVSEYFRNAASGVSAAAAPPARAAPKPLHAPAPRAPAAAPAAATATSAYGGYGGAAPSMQQTMDKASYLERNMAALKAAQPSGSAPRPAYHPPASTGTALGSSSGMGASYAPQAALDDSDDDAPPPPPPR